MHEDDIVLSTGKKIYANCGYVGISKDYQEKEWSIREGYDGHIWLQDYNSDKDDYDARFTKNELIELANMMQGRWEMFKQDVIAGKVKTNG